MKRIHATVSGRVQGVGFRWATRDRATELGVTGWVRNRPGGAVELEAQGDDDAVEQFQTWLQSGPPGARVDDVTATPGTVDGHESEFEIRR